MKKFLVVAYDIADDRRRKRISDILSGYGKRANFSVFECFLNEKDIHRLKERIKGEMKASKDSIIYYYLCKDCLNKIERESCFHEKKRPVMTL